MTFYTHIGSHLTFLCDSLWAIHYISNPINRAVTTSTSHVIGGHPVAIPLSQMARPPSQHAAWPCSMLMLCPVMLLIARLIHCSYFLLRNCTNVRIIVCLLSRSRGYKHSERVVKTSTFAMNQFQQWVLGAGYGWMGLVAIFSFIRSRYLWKNEYSVESNEVIEWELMQTKTTETIFIKWFF